MSMQCSQSISPCHHVRALKLRDILRSSDSSSPDCWIYLGLLPAPSTSSSFNEDYHIRFIFIFTFHCFMAPQPTPYFFGGESRWRGVGSLPVAPRITKPCHLQLQNDRKFGSCDRNIDRNPCISSYFRPKLPISFRLTVLTVSPTFVWRRHSKVRLVKRTKMHLRSTVWNWGRHSKFIFKGPVFGEVEACIFSNVQSGPKNQL